jgi:hypothetical protein
VARTVTGTLVQANNETPWPEASIIFRLTGLFVTSGATYPSYTWTTTTDESGEFSVDLSVPETGTARYQCTLPDGSVYFFNVQAGAVTTLEALIAATTAAGEADALQTLIDIHEAAADPHPGYLTEAEGDALYAELAHSHGGSVEDHEAESDPHPQYLTAAEGSAAYAALSHTHSGADITSGTVVRARLPVAASGTSSATELVGADDSRLSNSRTPTTHATSHQSGGADALDLGLLAGTLTDVQHGSRGGGGLHAVAVASGASGFLSGSDKARIDSAALVNAANVFTSDQRINARLSLNAAPSGGVAQGTVEITPTTSSQFLLRLLGLSGQSGGYLDVRDNTDAILTAITSAGILQAMAGFQVRAAKGDSTTVYTSQTGNNPNNLFRARQTGGTAIGAQAIASQTGDQYRALDVSGNTLWAVLVGGAMEFAEISAPATPAADKARLYVRDNGSGKTQLGVVFSDGVFIALATQA